MLIRRFRFTALGLALLGLAWAVPGLRAASGARGDEATHRLMTESLVAERDLIFDHRDVQRGYQAWPAGPRGLRLLSVDGGESFRYAQPLLYALLAAPWVAVAGEAGFYLLNLLLLLAAWWLVSRETAALPWAQPLLLVGFFLASAVFGFAFRTEPQALRFALVSLALLFGRRALRQENEGFRGLPWLAGFLLGASASVELLDLVPAAVLGLDAAFSRRWRALGALLAAGALSWGCLAVAQRHLQLAPAPSHHAEARRFFDAVPVEAPPSLWQETAPEAQGSKLRPARSASGWVHEVGYLAGGRSGGLLVFYPFALLALGLGLGGSWERQRWLPALGFLVGLAWVLASPPGLLGAAPLSGLGDPRLTGLMPLALLLPARPAGRALEIATWMVAGLLTLPALALSLGPPRGTPPGLLARLPLELTRMAALEPGGGAAAGLPGYQARALGEAVWLLPEDRFFLEENNPRGVWMQGATTAEVVVVSPRPITHLELTVVALAEDVEVELEGDAGRVRIRFDSAGKRAGAPLSVPMAAVARDLGGFFPQETYYRLRIRCSSGLVPARRDPTSSDRRYLGAFFDFGFEAK